MIAKSLHEMAHFLETPRMSQGGVSAGLEFATADVGRARKIFFGTELLSTTLV